MAKKYDTNPLDKDILQRAEAAQQTESQTARTSQDFERPTELFEADTRPFAKLAPTAEMPTQPFDNNLNEPYQSVFNSAKSFAPMSNSFGDSVSDSMTRQAIVVPPTARKVLGLGLPENLCMVLPYLPFQIGAIIAVIELFFVSRVETRVRFHAAQALALHIASWIITIILGFIGKFAFFGSGLTKIFYFVVLGYFIVSIVRVWRGKANHIEALDDVTDFLNEKIKPRK